MTTTLDIRDRKRDITWRLRVTYTHTPTTRDYQVPGGGWEQGDGERIDVSVVEFISARFSRRWEWYDHAWEAGASLEGFDCGCPNPQATTDWFMRELGGEIEAAILDEGGADA